jgi:hypothetical protein
MPAEKLCSLDPLESCSMPNPIMGACNLELSWFDYYGDSLCAQRARSFYFQGLVLAVCRCVSLKSWQHRDCIPREQTVIFASSPSSLNGPHGSRQRGEILHLQNHRVTEMQLGCRILCRYIFCMRTSSAISTYQRPAFRIFAGVGHSL